MKAARYYSGTRGLKIEEVEDPAPGPGEVVVSIKAAGLCGTDLHIAWEQSFPVVRSPIILGHEGSGVIEALGEGVAGWKIGERVSFYPSIPCGACPPCGEGRISLCPAARIFGVHIDGTFAEKVSLPAQSLIRVPDSVSFEVAAVLSDAVATAYHAVRKRGALERGESVAVFGCGGVGYHAILFARLLGAARIIAVDKTPGALKRARAAGASDLLNAAEEEPAKAIKRITGGAGVDVAFEFVGSAATVVEAMRSLGRPGRVVVVGVGAARVELPPLTAFVGKEMAVIGSMGSYRDDLEEVLDLVVRGALDLSGSITHRFPLERINEGLDALATKAGDPIRVVVQP